MSVVEVPDVAKTVLLKQLIPDGMPQDDHFDIRETPAPTAADLTDGSMLVVLRFVSADPYLRWGMRDDEAGPVPRVMKGFVVGQVAATRRDGWAVGDWFGASLPFTTVQTIEAGTTPLMWKLEDHIGEGVSPSLGLGVLGMPGSTAYGGFLDILRPKNRDAASEASDKPDKPEVVWVSGAAGAVGSLVGQIAKNVFGCTVIGSCGGAEKCKLVKEKFGFDHCVDYKTVSTAEELEAKLREVAPEGIDMYFDNVGGIHFEAAMACLRPQGRVAICGTISSYNEGKPTPVRLFPTKMIYTAQRVEGFVCMPWLTQQKGNFLKDMARWMKEGKITAEETVFDGVEQWPTAFRALFTGGNTGKVVVRV